MSRKRKVRGILCAVGSAALWGCSGTVGQNLMASYGVGSGWLVTIRMLGAGFLLLLVGLIRRLPLLDVWKSRRSAGMLVVFALAGLMTAQYTYLSAISYSNSATATALQYSGQALILGVTCVSMRRWPRFREWGALLMAFTAIFLLCTHGNIHTLTLNPLAVAWGLASAVSLVFYTLLPQGITRTYGSVPAIGFGMLLGGTVLFFLIRAWTCFPVLDAAGWAGVAFMSVGGTAVAFSLFFQAVRDLGGVMAGLLTCCEPAVAAVVTRLWLKTDLAGWDYLAFALITLMAVLLSWPTRSSRELGPGQK